MTLYVVLSVDFVKGLRNRNKVFLNEQNKKITRIEFLKNYSGIYDEGGK